MLKVMIFEYRFHMLDDVVAEIFLGKVFVVLILNLIPQFKTAE